MDQKSSLFRKARDFMNAHGIERRVHERMEESLWQLLEEVYSEGRIAGREEWWTEQDEEESDGQPDEYTEWQDYMGGDDWDHGQYD